MKIVDGMPRRCRVNLYTHAERSIWQAMQEVENAGAHPLLTDAINLLIAAREKVADFVELPEVESPK